MRKIIIAFILFLIGLKANCQENTLKLKIEGTPLPVIDSMTYEIGLFCVSGFDDSVSIYLNHIPIQTLYVQSISGVHSAYIPINISVNFKRGQNLLEIEMKKSKKRYFTCIVKGYAFANFYFWGDPTVVYTNRRLVHE